LVCSKISFAQEAHSWVMEEENFVELVSCTENPEALILKVARVSSANPDSDNVKLIGYLIRNNHWSPFEHAYLTFKIRTTRDISRQILRHRSFTFQEFSQRYQDVTLIQREARLQDLNNRQNSISCTEENESWNDMQKAVWKLSMDTYVQALSMGIAKEQARVLLPEGLTETIVYMTGNIRSWLHYCDLRGANGTQREHMRVANEIKVVLMNRIPNCAKAMGW
jgi:thymidylate synthase (FAD)